MPKITGGITEYEVGDEIFDQFFVLPKTFGVDDTIFIRDVFRELPESQHRLTFLLLLLEFERIEIASIHDVPKNIIYQRDMKHIKQAISIVYERYGEKQPEQQSRRKRR